APGLPVFRPADRRGFGLLLTLAKHAKGDVVASAQQNDDPVRQPVEACRQVGVVRVRLSDRASQVASHSTVEIRSQGEPPGGLARGVEALASLRSSLGPALARTAIRAAVRPA